MKVDLFGCKFAVTDLAANLQQGLQGLKTQVL